MDVLKEMKQAIAEMAIYITKGITPETKIEDLDTDSLDRVEIVMLMEEKCHIDIDDAEADKCVTVGDVVAMCERLMKERNSTGG